MVYDVLWSDIIQKKEIIKTYNEDNYIQGYMGEKEGSHL